MYWTVLTHQCMYIDIWVLSPHGLIHLTLNISFPKLIAFLFMYIRVCVCVCGCNVCFFHSRFCRNSTQHLENLKFLEVVFLSKPLSLSTNQLVRQQLFLFQDNFATRGIDYDFYPSSEDVQWQEGESDRHNFSEKKTCQTAKHGWRGVGTWKFHQTRLTTGRCRHLRLYTQTIPNHFPIWRDASPAAKWWKLTGSWPRSGIGFQVENPSKEPESWHMHCTGREHWSTPWFFLDVFLWQVWQVCGLFVLLPGT